VHPNIVTIHSIGQAQNLYYLEMEFVPGRSLRQLVEDEGRLNATRATEIAARIAAGLAAAHRAGIVHRDLKPDNVLLTVTSVPKIVDFGLAKRVRSKSGTGSVAEQSLCGTPLFMAPELFHGTEATPASDIYALGVTYYRMLCGTFPFAGNTLAELMNTVTSTPLPNIRQVVPDLSLEVAEVLGLMLDKSIGNRPQTGTQAVQLLQAILGEARDLEVLLREAFRDDSRVEWVSAEDRHLLTVVLPENRRQRVVIESSRHGTAERLLQISSLCCTAKPAYYEQALRLNSEMPHGGIGVQDIDGEPQFLVLDTYPRATVDAEEIRRSVHEVASRADAIEKLLTGRDRN
jgi:serine/threonine-protein kinase